MKITVDDIAGVDTGPFGKVPNDRIDHVTFDGLNELRQDIFQSTRRASDTGELRDMALDEEFLKKLEQYRTDVGALWLQLRGELDADIVKAYRVSDTLWQCMWVSLVQRRLKPHKYYALCGIPSDGYGGLAAYLANLPHQEQIFQRWGCASWKEYADEVWRTKDELIDKEREYRNAAIAVRQIGVGFGGMLVGLVGIIVSVIVSWFQ